MYYCKLLIVNIKKCTPLSSEFKGIRPGGLNYAGNLYPFFVTNRTPLSQYPVAILPPRHTKHLIKRGRCPRCERTDLTHNLLPCLLPDIRILNHQPDLKKCPWGGRGITYIMKKSAKLNRPAAIIPRKRKGCNQGAGLNYKPWHVVKDIPRIGHRSV